MSRKQVGKYILDKRIGKGSYAQVWSGHCEDTQEGVAVKVISRHTVNETAQLRQEVAVLKRIDHPNIVKFKDLKKSVGHFYLVLEYCQGGDLARFIQRHGAVREETAQRFLRQLSAGLLTLHRLSFIHRDLKPQNILLTIDSEEATLKIADFGFARVLDACDMAATVCGSPLYMAPEILRHERYDAKADLWSLGAILFELLFGRPPYTGPNPMQLLATIEQAPAVIPLPTDPPVSRECAALIQAVLVREAQSRISTEAFFSDAYNLGPSVLEPAETQEDSSDRGEEDITLIEETSPVSISTPPSVIPAAAESVDSPVVIATGTVRALSDAIALQHSGSLADTYAGTQAALGMILRYIASEVANADDDRATVDAFGLVGRSCEFLNSALDEIVDKRGTSAVELELKASLDVAASIQSKLTYRGFTQSAHPLRWIVAFCLRLAEDVRTETEFETRRTVAQSCVLLCDFLLSEVDPLTASNLEEEFAKDQTTQLANQLRSCLTDLIHS